jgi:hypothetical protein
VFVWPRFNGTVPLMAPKCYPPTDAQDNGVAIAIWFISSSCKSQHKKKINQ